MRKVFVATACVSCASAAALAHRKKIVAREGVCAAACDFLSSLFRTSSVQSHLCSSLFHFASSLFQSTSLTLHCCTAGCFHKNRGFHFGRSLLGLALLSSLDRPSRDCACLRVWGTVYLEGGALRHITQERNPAPKRQPKNGKLHVSSVSVINP